MDSPKWSCGLKYIEDNEKFRLDESTWVEVVVYLLGGLFILLAIIGG